MNRGWVTLQQVADKAGVSRATASRALRHVPGTAADTVRRVAAAARALGYCPDPQLSELTLHLRRRKAVSGRPVIAYIHDMPPSLFERYAMRSEGRGNVYLGAAAQAHKLGFTLSPFCIDDEEIKGERISNILRSRGIRRVIISPAVRPATPISLRWNWFTSVAIGHSTKLPPFHRVAAHQFQGMIELVQRLFNLGYRHPGLATVPTIDFRTQGNYRAAYLMLRSIHEPGRLAPILVSEGSCRDTFERWLEEHRIDVVIRGGQAIPVMEWLEAPGRRIPQDIGYADLQLMKSDSAISGIDQNELNIGAAAIDLVVSLTNDGLKGLPKVPKSLYVSGSWVEGSTTRRVGRSRGSIWATAQSQM